MESIELPERGAALYRKHFPRNGDPNTDLMGWAEIEAGRTNLFGPMYKFALIRTANDSLHSLTD